MEHIDPQPHSITYKKTTLELKEEEIIKGKPYQGIESLKNMGFQCSKTYESYVAIKHAIKNNYKIAIGFTSNTITGGMRAIIKDLCRLNLVHCVVTTGGGVEEDLIQSVVPFYYGKTVICDKLLNEWGVNRTENIYCPNEGYVWLENLLLKLGKQEGFYNTDPIKLVNLLSKEVTSPESYLYWCRENSIPVIPISLEDGAIGDHFGTVYYKKLFKGETPPILNSAGLIPAFINTLYSKNNSVKTCVISLGGGSSKHFLMNGCIPLGGCDMAVYYNNGDFSDGSNAGAPPSEAISWGKLKKDSIHIKVHGDFYFTFYLVASQLIKEFNSPLKNLSLEN